MVHKFGGAKVRALLTKKDICGDYYHDNTREIPEMQSI